MYTSTAGKKTLKNSKFAKIAKPPPQILRCIGHISVHFFKKNL